MRAIRPFIVIALLLATCPLFAQSQAAPPIERQMSADEFKAAHEGKCGEGKCGGDKPKAQSEGKCGEGKCGGMA